MISGAKTSFTDISKLWLVRAVLGFQNLFLDVCGCIVFRKINSPRNILIFKVGTIGDVTCAIPSFIAIRRAFPDARVTLLTSPGKRGLLGAEEIVSGAWYLDSVINYHSEDIATWKQKKDLAVKLREKKFDFFIQIPDDWASFKTLFRNMLFAKVIGARSAIGFKVRTFLKFFRKTQIDNLIRKNEAEAQLEILKEGGIPAGAVEFDLAISSKIDTVAKEFLSGKLGADAKLIAICAGGKDESKKWPIDRFAEVAEYFSGKGFGIVILGGGASDVETAKIISEGCGGRVVDMTNGSTVREQAAVLKYCEALLTNDTGPMHLAAAVGARIVALFSIRNILGTWFPYGEGHKILYKRNLACDYRNQACVRRSLEEISVEEVIRACEEILKQ